MKDKIPYTEPVTAPTHDSGRNADNSPRNEGKKKRRFRERSFASRILIVAAWSIMGLVGLTVAVLCGVTWWLTPERLTNIVNREASRTLKADVAAHNIRFTFWSTFPHLCVEMDSVRITSRALAGMPDSVTEALPDDAAYLMSAGKMKGGVNIWKLLGNRVSLSDVEVNGVNLNLVAVNDSVSNYNIFPSTGERIKIPDISADKIILRNPGNIKYLSLADDARANVSLKTAQLVKAPKSDHLYRLDLSGVVDASSGDLMILNEFPFNLGGNVDIGFNPVSLKVNDYKVALGNLSGHVDMAMQMGDKMSIDTLRYRLDDFNVEALSRYFPPEIFPRIGDIGAELNVNATARLTAPYRFSVDSLPSGVVDIRVVDGEIGYTLDGRQYALRHDGLQGELVFDGKNPGASYFEVPEFSLSGEGTALDLYARVDDLTGEPKVNLLLKGDADMRHIGAAVAPLKPYGLKGALTADAAVYALMKDFPSEEIEDVKVNGDVSLRGYGVKIPEMKFAAAGKTLDVRFGASADGIDSETMNNGLYDVNAVADNVKIDVAGYAVRGNNVTASGKMRSKGRLNAERLNRILPFDIRVKGGEMDLASATDTVRVHATNLDIAGRAAVSPRKGADHFDLQISGDRIACSMPDMDVKADKVKTKVNADRLRRRIRTAEYKLPDEWTADRASMKEVGHSAEYLAFAAPAKLKRLMERWKVGVDLGVGHASVLTPVFPMENKIDGLQLAASFDSINIRRMSLRSGDTGMRMSGKVEDLRQFIVSDAPAPLCVKLDVALDTVQINQLARAYEHGVVITKGADAAKLGPPPTAVSPSDTIAMLIPRNVTAYIKATAMMTRYMDLHLYDLSTAVNVRDGVVDVSGLKISSDFGKANLGFKYDSGNIERLHSDINVGVEQIDVVNFFKNFHTLLLMMPQMRNLSGMLSAEASAHLYLFPNMYVNIPSVWADVYVHGRGLKVHQDPFIRKITRMMMIRTHDDLEIANMDVHASMHDNLLELYPFDFDFDRYRLRMGGVNNFDGKMYYHIGIEKSPIPFPFGINIQGEFHHPQLRFGGAAYKVSRGAEITGSVMEDNKLNAMMQMKYYMQEFIHKAAESDTTAQKYYVY